jgi:hypothetical protein
MNSFNEIMGLDLQKAKNEISFPVRKEHIFTEDNQLVNKNAIIDESNDDSVLGLVSPKRGIIQYPQVMEWVTGVFDRVGTPYKLMESTFATRSKNLFQSYIFDASIDTPDGQNLSPMFLLRSSYVGSPLTVDLGTYRFVCSNGVTIGNTFKSIKVKGNDVEGLLTHDLLTEIRMSLENILKIGERYSTMFEEDMKDYLVNFFSSPRVPVAFKKLLLDRLVGEGTIQRSDEEVLKGEHFLSMNMSNNIIKPRGKDSELKIIEEKSAWDLYNTCTELSSHNTRNVSTRDWYNAAISEVFVA